ncbi:MAG: response regulator [Desulfobacteraceae bacterium]|nr:response regulator [Desulfobacteraceae bacterium]MDH3722728.1 response regulator [Desulfobacteraceae bacterium]MDH3838899.1 response regulator [Desulfobacteraceae bacterium]MDH3872593.1 response regulator [Desulfobacteraceae bacterium]
MEKGIVVLDANKKQCQGICSFLDELDYQATPMYSVNNLSEFIREGHCGLLILDLDTIEVDKNLFRKLKRTKPSLSIVGLSSRSFHPELQEAMSSHIYACLSKPLDEEELIFWVKSLF